MSHRKSNIEAPQQVHREQGDGQVRRGGCGLRTERHERGGDDGDRDDARNEEARARSEKFARPVDQPPALR